MSDTAPEKLILRKMKPHWRPGNWQSVVTRREGDVEFTRSDLVGEPFCDVTGKQAIGGTCPVHGGDGCLKTPLGFIEHIARLEREVSRLEHYADRCERRLEGYVGEFGDLDFG